MGKEVVSQEIIDTFNRFFDYGKYKKMRFEIQKNLDKAKDEPGLLRTLEKTFDYAEPYGDQTTDLYYFVTKTLPYKVSGRKEVFIEYTFNIYFNEEEEFGFIDYVSMGVAKNEDDFADYICSFDPYRIQLFRPEHADEAGMVKFL